MAKRAPPTSPLPGIKPERSLSVLPPPQAALVYRMLDAWYQRRRGTLRHEELSVANGIRTVLDFIRHSGSPPWAWTERQLDSWCYDIGVVRRLAVSTQRSYLHAIRTFLDYLCHSVALQNEVRREFGTQVRQICSSENMVPHLYARELVREREAMSHAHINHFFAELDKAIAEARRFSSKALRPLQRDKALFAITYFGGLRADEVVRLNLHSFHANPQMPAMGNYASVTVWGKGSRGGGKKLRTVWFTTVQLPPLVQWYIEQVRPHFVTLDNPDEQALFLSQRGTRLEYATLYARFRWILRYCGLDHLGYCPHSLRHSSVTHEAARFSLGFNRDKHGHVFASTTETYCHMGDEANTAELQRALQMQIDAAANAKTTPTTASKPERHQ